MKKIREDIKNGTFSHLYLLYGDEAYLRIQYRDMLIKAISGDDTMNLTIYKGKDISVPALIDQAETMPFFAERRLIVIEDSGLFKAEGQELAAYLKDIPETTYFVIEEASVDKRGSLYKTCQSVGYVSEMKTPDEMELKRWIARLLSADNKKMTERDIEYFIDTVGTDMVLLKNEVSKLSNFTGDREVVTRADVDEISTHLMDNDIFKMIEYVADRRVREALNMYYELIAQKEAPMKILSLITRQFNLLLQARELMLKNTPANTIAGKIGVPPFFVKKYMAQASKFDMETLKKALNMCVTADEDIKLGRVKDELSVELLIIGIDKELN